MLTFAQRGALPLSKIGELCRSHATSVTNVIDRLEARRSRRASPIRATARHLAVSPEVAGVAD